MSSRPQKSSRTRNSSGSSVEILPEPGKESKKRTSKQIEESDGDSDATIDLTEPISNGSKSAPNGSKSASNGSKSASNGSKSTSNGSKSASIESKSASAGTKRRQKSDPPLDTSSTLTKDGLPSSRGLKAVDSKRRKMDPPKPASSTPTSGKSLPDASTISNYALNASKSLASIKKQSQPTSDLGKDKRKTEHSSCKESSRKSSTSSSSSSSDPSYNPYGSSSSRKPGRPVGKPTGRPVGRPPTVGRPGRPSNFSKQQQQQQQLSSNKSAEKKDPKKGDKKDSKKKGGVCRFCKEEETDTPEEMRTHYMNCSDLKQMVQSLEKKDLEKHLAAIGSYFYIPKKSTECTCHICHEKLHYYQCNSTKVAKIIHIMMHGKNYRCRYKAPSPPPASERKDKNKKRKRKKSREELSDEDCTTEEIEERVMKYFKAMESRKMFSSRTCPKCKLKRNPVYRVRKDKPDKPDRLPCWLCSRCPYELCRMLPTTSIYYKILGDFPISKIERLHYMFNNPNIPDGRDMNNLFDRMKLEDNMINRRIFEVFIKGTRPEDLKKHARKFSSSSSDESSQSFHSLPALDDALAVIPADDDPAPRLTTPLNDSDAMTPVPDAPDEPTLLSPTPFTVQIIRQGPVTVSSTAQTDPQPESPEPVSTLQCGSQTEPSVSHFSAQYIASSVDSGTQVENRGWNDLGWIVAACGHKDVGQLKIRELGEEAREADPSELGNLLMKKGFLELCYYVQGKLKKLCHLPLINAFLQLSVGLPGCKLVTDSLLAQLKPCCLSLVHWSALRDLSTCCSPAVSVSALEVSLLVDKELSGRLTSRRDTKKIWKRIISQAHENLPPSFWITTWPLARSKLPLSTLTSLVLEKWFSQIENRESLAALRPEGLPTPDVAVLEQYGVSSDNLKIALIKPDVATSTNSPAAAVSPSSSSTARVGTSSLSSGLTTSGTQYEVTDLLRSGSAHHVNSQINVTLPSNAQELIPFLSTATRWREEAEMDVARLGEVRNASVRELDRTDVAIQQAESNVTNIREYGKRIMQKFTST